MQINSEKLGKIKKIRKKSGKLLKIGILLKFYLLLRFILLDFYEIFLVF